MQPSRTWPLLSLALLLALGCGKQADPSLRDAPKRPPTPPPAPSPRLPTSAPDPVPSEPAVPGPALSPGAYVRTPPVKKGQDSWTIETEKGLAFGNNSLQFTSDGQLLLLAEMSPAEMSRWVRWDFGRDTLAAAPCEGKYTVLAPDGKSCVRAEDANVQLLDGSGEVRAMLPGHKVAPQWVAFAPDGKVLATGVEDGLRLWDTGTGNKLRASEKKFPDFSRAAFSPDGKTVALAQVVPDRKGLLSFLPVATVAVERTIDLVAPLHTLAWSPDGKRLAAVDWDGRLVLLDVPGGKVVHTGTKNTANDARPCWTADGRLLAVAGKDFGIALWDMDSGKVLRTCSGHTSNVNALALSPDGKTLVSASADKSVRFWDLDTAALCGTLVLLPDNQWLAISPGGHYKGSAKIEEQFAYKVELEKFKQKQIVEYTPLEFDRAFGWVNKPEEVRLSPREDGFAQQTRTERRVAALIYASAPACGAPVRPARRLLVGEHQRGIPKSLADHLLTLGQGRPFLTIHGVEG